MTTDCTEKIYIMSKRAGAFRTASMLIAADHCAAEVHRHRRTSQSICMAPMLFVSRGCHIVNEALI